MRSHLAHLAVVTGLTFASMTAFAEPPVQAGETLESLSKVKVSTTVNGQPGSLNELLASGQIKVLPGTQSAAAPAPASAPAANPAQQNPVEAAPATQPAELQTEQAPQTEAPQAAPAAN